MRFSFGLEQQSFLRFSRAGAHPDRSGGAVHFLTIRSRDLATITMTTIDRCSDDAGLRLEVLRGRVVRGSAILLLSSGLVAAANLLYNILIARMLGPSGFGHASALYTLLMLMSAITLSFQIVTSKFIARNSDILIQAQIYASMLRRAWQVGLGIAVVLAAGSAYLKSYFNLPAATGSCAAGNRDRGVHPAGSPSRKDAGLLQLSRPGCQRGGRGGGQVRRGPALPAFRDGRDRRDDGGVAFNCRGIPCWRSPMRVPGGTRLTLALIKIAPFGEGMQAVLYFIGQVILSNLDILLVKHFFPPRKRESTRPWRWLGAWSSCCRGRS